MAETLRLRTVAEGIEREDQVAELRRLDCTLGQGYHYSRPLPAAEVEELLVLRGRTDAPVVASRGGRGGGVR